MSPLSSTDIRTNLATWAVPVSQLAVVGNWMHDALPREPYDRHFRGQRLETTYFDTAEFALRRARRSQGRYLTLRVRCYDNGQAETYALSTKTESEKWRIEIASEMAHDLLTGMRPVHDLLPPHLAARLDELTGEQFPAPVVAVTCRRYAVENEVDRFTLDAAVHTSLGKCLPFGVLEFKSSEPGGDRTRIEQFSALPPLSALKLSKFLWATRP
jgi:hypothetical protein